MVKKFQISEDPGEKRSKINGMNKRVLQYYEDAKRIKKVLSSYYPVKTSDIPYPKMAYIYPTYQCSLNCKNCMYKDHITKCMKNDSLDMDLDLFRHILGDLSSLGVMNAELCGGGEPLEHSHINELIEVISEFRKNKGMDFGILTNGQNISQLDENTVKMILKCSAYIRLSYSERSNTDKRLRKEYFHNLTKLLEYKNENNKLKSKIGSKLLLTSKNKDELLKTVSELFELGVEHIRVKSIRSSDDEPSIKDIIEFGKELDLLKSEKQTKVLHVDLGRTFFPEGFKCWINPLSTTIDPYGGIYICFNFHNDPENMMIGKYTKTNSLDDFWSENAHIDKIRKINTNKVCKSSKSCNCRFVDYQAMIEDIINGGNDLKIVEDKVGKYKFSRQSERIKHFF